MSQRMSLVLGSCLAVLLAAATVASATGRIPTYIRFGPGSDQHAAHPHTIFLSADAGPELTRIGWQAWGGAQTKAIGFLVNRCASTCTGARVAHLTLSGWQRCPHSRSMTYTRGLLISPAANGQPRTVIRFPQYAPIAYCP